MKPSKFMSADDAAALVADGATLATMGGGGGLVGASLAVALQAQAKQRERLIKAKEIEAASKMERARHSGR